MEPVRNHRNKTVVEAARLHRARVRRAENRTLLEGPALLNDALAAGGRVHSVFAMPGDDDARSIAAAHDLEVTPVDRRALSRVAGTETPRGPVAVVEIPTERLDADRDVLVSWGVSDPGNVGTLIRTAAAFGWGYAYSEGSADPWAPKTVRAGAAGQFQTPVRAIDGLEELSAWTTLATVVEGGRAPASVTAARVAVLIGAEAPGLPADVEAACSERLTIRTPGATESLNAAIAAGIVVYELSKRPGQAGAPV